MLRRTALLIASLLVAVAAYAQDDAQEAATRFYGAYQKLRQAGMTGIPDARQLRQLLGLITPHLRALFEAAAREQRRCAQRFPDEKPPWIEGDIFSSNFEGYTAFRAGPGGGKGNVREVPVDFRYADGKDQAQWRDVLILRNADGRWLIEDVRYEAHFPFGSGFGTNLQSSLKAIPACGN